jgi:TRAP-type mannitol/chloroaromatic compound transport system permease large subunit
MKNYRKWSALIVALLLTFVLAWFGKLTPEFVSIVTIIVPVFIGGNAVEYLKK